MLVKFSPSALISSFMHETFHRLENRRRLAFAAHQHRERVAHAAVAAPAVLAARGERIVRIDPHLALRTPRRKRPPEIAIQHMIRAVGESVRMPIEYYDNNINSMLTVLELMNEYNVTDLVFSSSATVV